MEYTQISFSFEALGMAKSNVPCGTDVGFMGLLFGFTVLPFLTVPSTKCVRGGSFAGNRII